MTTLQNITCAALITLSASFPLGLEAASVGGSDAGNGGGIAEKNLAFAHQNIAKFLDSCLLTSVCHLDEKETALLNEIRKSSEIQNIDLQQLVFISGQTQPDSFKIDGQVRVAKTSDQIGSKIYINSDLLYWQGSAGEIQAVDIPSAVSILVHEFGHHHGIKDHTFLDTVGTKMQTALLKHTEVSSIWNGEIRFTVVQNNSVLKDDDKKNLRAIDQVLVGYNDQLVELTGQLMAAVRCPTKGQTVKGLRIYNLHAEHEVTYIGKTRLIKRPLRAWYILSCKDGEETDHGDLSIVLGLRRNTKTKAPEFYPSESSFSQESCIDHPHVCK